MRTIVATALLSAALLVVAAPAAAQVEVGENDFKISGFYESDKIPGPATDAGVPAVAYNSTDDEYLVVWRSRAFRDPDVCPLFPVVYTEEVKARRFDPATGDPIGDPVRVSSTCDETRDVRTVDVAYNATDNEYLVVWSGEDAVEGGKYNIVGQLLSATLAPLGSDDFNIGVMGDADDDSFDAFNPSVVHNSTENEFLVVWDGDDDVGGLADGEDEIFGQRLDDDGGPLGANDFRISDMGGTGNTAFDASRPSVAYNSADNEYLVVWYGEDNSGGLVDGEREIYGQRLNENGTEQGVNDFRISDMGGTGDATYGAFVPAVAYNAVDNEYLVVWSGDDDVGDLVDEDDEIFGQRLDASGGEVGSNDFRISDMGDEVASGFFASSPEVAHDPLANDYLVVWTGEDNEGGLVLGDREIFGQRLDRAGLEKGPNDFRISDMGGTGDNVFDADVAALAFAPPEAEALVVWRGDDDEDGGVDNEYHVFGQRLQVPLFDDGFESGDTTRWSNVQPPPS